MRLYEVFSRDAPKNRGGPRQLPYSPHPIPPLYLSAPFLASLQFSLLQRTKAFSGVAYRLQSVTTLIGCEQCGRTGPPKID